MSPQFALHAAHPDTCAMYCSDGRFTQPVEDYMRAHLYRERFDVLALPCGAALLDTSWVVGFSEVATVRKALLFLIDGHNIKTLVLIAHQDCGFYRERYPMDPPEARKAAQLDDLRRARAFLQAHRQGLEVRTLYATAVDVGVIFNEVA